VIQVWQALEVHVVDAVEKPSDTQETIGEGELTQLAGQQIITSFPEDLEEEHRTGTHGGHGTHALHTVHDQRFV